MSIYTEAVRLYTRIALLYQVAAQYNELRKAYEARESRQEDVSLYFSYFIF